MVEVRPNNHTTPERRARLNLLLTHADWRDEAWADQLPRLLAPMGVHVVRAASGREATRVIQSGPVHIAVVDLSLPLEQNKDEPGAREGGSRLLNLLARLDTPPPTVIIRRRLTRREDDRCLASALEAGAFAVVDRPVHLETVLNVMRRVLARHYADRWPDDHPRSLS